MTRNNAKEDSGQAEVAKKEGEESEEEESLDYEVFFIELLGPSRKQHQVARKKLSKSQVKT